MFKASLGFSLSAALAAGFSGCARPVIEGAQIEDLPPGFGYDPNCRSWSGIRLDRELLRQRCWFTRGEPSSSAVVSELGGLIDRAELERAMAAEAARPRSGTVLEPVEEVVIARHRGWGWHHTSSYNGEVTTIGYSALLPWGDRSYLIEFSGRRPRDRDRELARRTVWSFTVVRSGDLHVGKLLAALGLGVLGWFFVRRLRAARATVPPAPVGPPRLAQRRGSNPGAGLPKAPGR